MILEYEPSPANDTNQGSHAALLTEHSRHTQSKVGSTWGGFFVAGIAETLRSIPNPVAVSAGAEVLARCRVEGLWFMAYGLWCMMCGVWFIVHGSMAWGSEFRT